MERPSHTHFKTSCSFSCRITTFTLAAMFPLALVLGLTQGLGGKAIDVLHGPLQVQFDKAVEPRTPPPEPQMKDVAAPKAEMPVFEHKWDDGSTGIRTALPPADPQQSPPAQGPDRAAAGVLSTHTIPPYPVLAQRLGAEGRVTLRLTVLADGTVGRAEIVTSSGRGDLDEAAEQWIAAHWLYRPALDKGQPVTAQTVVSVIFSLRQGR